MALAVSRAELASGLRLSYAVQGDESGVAVVMLPGPTDAWPSYRSVLDHLPPSIRAVAVSQRGHGDSDKPATGYDVKDLATDAVALLDALGHDHAVLVGHSGSCLVARRVAIDHPERVLGLVLEATPGTLRGDARFEGFVESVSTLTDPVDPAVARSFVAATSSLRLPTQLQDELAEQVLKVPARVWKAMFASLLAYDDVRELGRVKAPTLMVWGDADVLVGRGVQEDIASRIPAAELVVYPGAGHAPRWEEPKRFAADIAGLVQRVCTTRG